jgi:predicted AlkP superfamily phosphohydrolase/phosphomutase
MNNRGKVLFIGLDAAEPRLVKKWMAEGALPNMKYLRDQGAYARVDPPYGLVGLPWPVFYTGTNPAATGVFHYLQWDPKTMSSKRLSREHISSPPFWRRFGKCDPRAIVIDVPLTTSPEPFNGIEIMGWATHETLEPLSAFPSDTLPWADAAVGPPPFFEERYGAFSHAEALEIRDRLIGMTNKVTRLAKMLMAKERWDLFMLVYSATHRAGHQLWDTSNVTSKMTENETKEITGSLKQVYIACDRGLGELMVAAGEDATVLVSSLHGMGFNHSRTELLPELIERILTYEAEHVDSQRPKLAGQLRALIPSAWRHAVKKRLPYRLQDSLTSFWRMGGTDWSRSPVISLLGDYDGYLQINLKGREAGGIVAPGTEYDYWVKIVATALQSFVDADSKDSIVRDILRREDLNFSGEKLMRFPDLVVQWEETPASRHREVVSPKYGTIRWPTPGRNPEGRSGNHRREGFLLARGDRFSPCSEGATVSIIDIAPIILDILGTPKPRNMEGNVIII